MTIHVTLPSVQATPPDRPRACPHCGHWRLHRHGHTTKPLRDPAVTTVTVHRYRCAACRHTFRHYPPGVTAAEHSQRLVALGALLWAAGLSVRWCARLLAVFGLRTSPPSMWRAVQQVGAGLRRRPPGRARVLGVDGTALRRAGQTVGLLVTVEQTGGQVLTLERLDEHDPDAVTAWLAPLVATGGAELLVTDDLASHGTVAAGLGRERQICLFHLKRWVSEALEELEAELDGQWQAVIDQVDAEVERLEAAGGARLQQCWQAMREVRPPPHGRWPADVRLRHLVGRVSQHWAEYRRWAQHEQAPKTNNRTEQAIGRVKVRSRTVRGYKSVSGLLHGTILAAAVSSRGAVDLATPLQAA